MQLSTINVAVTMSSMVMVSFVGLLADAKRCNHTTVRSHRKAYLEPHAILNGALGANALAAQDNTAIAGCEGTANGVYTCSNGATAAADPYQWNLIQWNAANLGQDFTMELQLKVDYSGSASNGAAMMFTSKNTAGADQFDYIGFDHLKRIWTVGANFGGTLDSINFAQNAWCIMIVKRINNKLDASINGVDAIVHDINFAFTPTAVSLRPYSASIVVKYWKDVTTLSVTGLDVVLGDADAKTCPTGFAVVPTESDCRAAAPNSRVITAFVNEATAPAGCFVKSSDDLMYFNVNPDGDNSRAGDRLVCFGTAVPDCAIEDMTSITDITQADVETVTARFTQMSSEITSLQEQVTAVDTEISEVEGLAQNTATKFEEARTKIASIKSISSQNAASAGALETMANNYTTRVDASAAKLAEVQKVLKTLEEASLELATQSTQMSTKVAELESDTDTLLPGVGGIETRLSNAESSVANLRATVSAGTLENVIKVSLRGHFARATRHIQDLTDTVALEEAKKAAEER